MDADNARSLQLAYQRAVDLAQYKAGFLARAGHELRSPLNRLISLNQLILNDLCDSPEEQKSFIEEGHAAALELLSLLDQVIAVAKFEVGRATPKLSDHDLVDTLLELDVLAGLQVRDRGMVLTLDNPYDTVPVWTDSAWLAKALTGLIEVAIELAQGGRIGLTVSIHTHQSPDNPNLDNPNPDNPHSDNLGTVALTLVDDRTADAWATLIQELQTLDPAYLPAVDELVTLAPSSSPPTANLPKTALSPALRVYIAQQTLAMMGASCDIVPLNSPEPNGTDSGLYQMRCVLPARLAP